MKKIILFALLLSQVIACKKAADQPIDLAPNENIETLEIVTNAAQDAMVHNRGTCTLYNAIRIVSGAANGNYRLWQYNISAGTSTAVSPLLNLNGGKNVSWTVSDDTNYSYFIQYTNGTGMTIDTYFADVIAVQSNPPANCTVCDTNRSVSGTTDSAKARIYASCVVAP